jgi:hypothetical protein
MYKLTTHQYELLLGATYDGEQLFYPIADINGDYFISKQEIDNCTNEEFAWVKELELTEFKPPIIEL